MQVDTVPLNPNSPLGFDWILSINEGVYSDPSYGVWHVLTIKRDELAEDQAKTKMVRLWIGPHNHRWKIEDTVTYKVIAEGKM